MTANKDEEKRYGGLATVARSYHILSTLCFLLGCFSVMGAVIVPALLASSGVIRTGQPQFWVAAGLVVLGLTLLFGSWQFNIAYELMTLKLDMADYARRTTEAVEAMAASVRRK